jgi:hypothetical protein
MMNTTITTKLEWHPSHFNYTLVLKKLENTSQTQHCSIALKCNRLVLTMNMKPNMSIRSFVFYFCLNSGEFRSFFWSKFLCVGWNHIFQVQIWQNLTQKENTGLWAIQDSMLSSYEPNVAPPQKGFVNSHDAILFNNIENMQKASIKSIYWIECHEILPLLTEYPINILFSVRSLCKS